MRQRLFPFVLSEVEGRTGHGGPLTGDGRRARWPSNAVTRRGANSCLSTGLRRRRCCGGWARRCCDAVLVRVSCSVRGSTTLRYAHHERERKLGRIEWRA